MRPLLHHTIADRIVQDCIARAGLRPGDRLPSISQMQQRFNVSRNTVWQALNMLEQKGVLENRRGSGCYVLDATRISGSSQVRLIGFIAPASHGEILSSVYAGIERVTRRFGMHVLMMSADHDYQTERMQAHRAAEAGCEGLVIFPVTRSMSQLAHDYLNTELTDLPIVLVDMADPSHRRPKVVFDNYQAGYDMTQLMIEQGHRRIGIMQFTNAEGSYVSRSLNDRYNGFTDAMQQAGLPVFSEDHWVAPFHWGDYIPEMVALLQRWMAQPQRPTALIATDDHIAVAIALAAKRLGIKLPDDLQLAGFDNLVVARSFDPPFPTSAPDFIAMGDQAVRLVLQRAAGRLEPDATYVLPAPVIQRTVVSTSREYDINPTILVQSSGLSAELPV